MRQVLALIIGLLVLVGLRSWLVQPGTPDGVHQAQAVVLAPVSGVPASDPRLAVWTTALAELGFPGTVMTIPQLLDALRTPRDSAAVRAVILPDGVFSAGEVGLARALHDYVAAGGAVLASHDALRLALSPSGVSHKATVVALTGLSPDALASGLAAPASENGQIHGRPAAFNRLQIPPGKRMPVPGNARVDALSTYLYGRVAYPHFLFPETPALSSLLRTPDGTPLLWERRIGAGQVLLVNTPLGSLARQSDSLLQHAALRRVLQDQAGLPALSAAPYGIGGLVFNLHLDSNAALPTTERAVARGLFEQGPFSLHMTAGPDMRTPGDRRGMDLAHNPRMQKLLRNLQGKGHVLGSHGGWTHNHFADLIGTRPEAEMVPYLERNFEVVSQVSARPIREYSAPMGNQPEWKTAWLEKRGVLAYYFTGNTGMPPTRSYRNGDLRTQKIWSFPIMPFGPYAALEELDRDGVAEVRVTEQLVALADFVADTATVRTLYTHPPGFDHYVDALATWFRRTRDLHAEKRFNWYSMTEIAEFLNRREQVSWTVTTNGLADQLTAQHAASLAGMAWTFPKFRYAKPVIEAGDLAVVDAGSSWRVMVTAGSYVRIKIACVRP